MSASCSMLPDSLRSANCGLLFCLSSTLRLICDSATMGCVVETQRKIRNEQTKCLSCTIDEGRSLTVGLQEQASNNHKLLW
ncbi:hypothetical protein WALBB_90003 [Wolbachia pipientis wAlbB]|nr:hypothetical protein WALBB_90003 [Wolbachia pipientis wAlbB]